MAKRHTELSTDVVMNFRINPKMKAAIDERADEAGISSAEWMRRVLQEKLDGKTDDDLEKTIRRVVAEMVAERDAEKKQHKQKIIRVGPEYPDTFR